MLASESEYAAWIAAFGLQCNHFTVSLNHLKSFDGIGDLNRSLKEVGFIFNRSGGEIKGTKKDLLLQSSTMATKVRCDFADGEMFIPGCYYEFAERFEDESGQIFDGFLADSANKIFESTDDRGQ